MANTIISVRQTVDLQQGVTRNPDGSYTMCGGGLACFNSEGHYFPISAEIRNLFTTGSNLIKRVESGSLFAELDHPTRQPGEGEQDFIRRFMSLSRDREVCTFSKIEVMEKPVIVEGQPNPVYPIMITFTPSGIKKQAIIDSLNNPNSNTAFSIRALSKRSTVGSTTYRTLFAIITFDFVDRPGINFAKQSSCASKGTCKVATARTATAENENFDISVETLQDILTDNSVVTTENDNVLISNVIQYLKTCDNSNCNILDKF